MSNFKAQELTPIFPVRPEERGRTPHGFRVTIEVHNRNTKRQRCMCVVYDANGVGHEVIPARGEGMTAYDVARVLLSGEMSPPWI